MRQKRSVPHLYSDKKQKMPPIGVFRAWVEKNLSGYSSIWTIKMAEW